MWAACKGHIDSVRALLEHGSTCAFPNATDRRGETTAMHQAAAKGRHGVVRALVEHGANPNASNAEGETAGDWAQQKGHPHIIAYLERSKGWSLSTSPAPTAGLVERLKALLHAGADPRLLSAFSETPLQIGTSTDLAQGALPENEALLPWHPERHGLFPSNLRKNLTARVVAVLLVEQRSGQLATEKAGGAGRPTA